MAVTVKAGETYPAKDFRTGRGAKGAWALFKVKAEKGYDTINIWATNPEGLENAAGLKVKRIETVELKARLDEKTNRWYRDYNITAELVKTEDVRFGEKDMAKDEEDFVNSLFGV